jgi:hypothetical protein
VTLVPFSGLPGLGHHPGLSSCTGEPQEAEGLCTVTRCPLLPIARPRGLGCLYMGSRTWRGGFCLPPLALSPTLSGRVRPVRAVVVCPIRFKRRRAVTGSLRLNPRSTQILCGAVRNKRLPCSHGAHTAARPRSRGGPTEVPPKRKHTRHVASPYSASVTTSARDMHPACLCGVVGLGFLLGAASRCSSRPRSGSHQSGSHKPEPCRDYMGGVLWCEGSISCCEPRGESIFGSPARGARESLIRVGSHGRPPFLRDLKSLSDQLADLPTRASVWPLAAWLPRERRQGQQWSSSAATPAARRSRRPRWRPTCTSVGRGLCRVSTAPRSSRGTRSSR